MTDAFIQIPGSPEVLQSYRNTKTINGTPIAVDSEAVTPTDPSGNAYSSSNRYPVDANLSVGGLVVSNSNPVPISGSVTASGATLNIVSALSATNFSLNGVGYNQTTSIGGPYELTSLDLLFSTALPKNITLTNATTGTTIVNLVNDTRLSIPLNFNGKGYAAGQQLQFQVSSTSGACLMSFSLNIKNGQLPMGGNPVLGTNTLGTYVGDVSIADGRMLDAAGRLRVSEPETIGDHKHLYDSGPLVFKDVGTGTSSFDYNTASVVLGNGATTSGIIQTHIKHAPLPYQPAKSQYLKITGVLGPNIGNVVTRMGLTENVARSNSLHLSQNGVSGTVRITYRTNTSGSTVETTIDQANWNVDKFDGSGPSKATLDLTKDNILAIDYQWLSAGRIRFGFEIGGIIYIAHQQLNSNVLTVPFTRTPNFRPFWQIENVGTAASTATMRAICYSMISEGGRNIIGRSYSGSTGDTAVTVAAANTMVPLFAVRPKLTLNGNVNQIIGSLVELNVVSDHDGRFQVIYFPTFTGGTFVSAGSNSGFEFAGPTGLTFTGGEVFQENFVQASSKSAQLQESIVNVAEIMSLTGDDAAQIGFVVQINNLGSGNANVRASMRWLEQY